MDKAIIYLTCNTHPQEIELACRKQLDAARGDIPVFCVSREPVDYGYWRTVIEGPRGPVTLHKQIVAALQRLPMSFEQIFLCENDVLYHPTHFDFDLPRRDTFYYNTNVWRVRYEDGFSIWTDDLQQSSGLSCDSDLAWRFYLARLNRIGARGWDRHFEPGPKVGNWETGNWQSEYPNLDIRHKMTYTKSKWKPSEFRNPQYARGWRETFDVLPGWDSGAAIMDRIRDGTF